MLGYCIASRAIAELLSIKNMDQDEAQETVAILPIHAEPRVQVQYAEPDSIKPTRG